MATIRIPTPLRKLTQGKEEVTATGSTRIEPATSPTIREISPLLRGTSARLTSTAIRNAHSRAYPPDRGIGCR